MTNEHGPAETPPSSSRTGPDRNLWLGIIGVLLLVAVGVYIWKELEVRSVRGEAEAEREELVERSERAVDQRTRDLLRLSALPLGWTVQTEMTRRNMEAVDRHLGELIREPGVEQVVLGGVRDTVLLATDRLLLGRPFSERFPAELLEREEPTVEAHEENLLRMVIPIMGDLRRLGTLVVVYRPEELRLRDADADGPPATDTPAVDPATDDSEPGQGTGNPAG